MVRFNSRWNRSRCQSGEFVELFFISGLATTDATQRSHQPLQPFRQRYRHTRNGKNRQFLKLFSAIKIFNFFTQKKFVYKINAVIGNLTYVIGQLLENRLYEVSLTSFTRAGESQGSRTVTVAPISNGNSLSIQENMEKFLNIFVMFM